MKVRFFLELRTEGFFNRIGRDCQFAVPTFHGVLKAGRLDRNTTVAPNLPLNRCEPIGSSGSRANCCTAANEIRATGLLLRLNPANGGHKKPQFADTLRGAVESYRGRLVILPGRGGADHLPRHGTQLCWLPKVCSSPFNHKDFSSAVPPILQSTVCGVMFENLQRGRVHHGADHI